MIKYEYHGTKEQGQLDNITVAVKEAHHYGASINCDLTHVERHSPDGFQWGYGGSGPADLALSILIHFCKKRDLLPEVAEKYYQEFKFAFIVPADNELKITCKDIARWLADKDPQLEDVLFEERKDDYEQKA